MAQKWIAASHHGVLQLRVVTPVDVAIHYVYLLHLVLWLTEFGHDWLLESLMSRLFCGLLSCASTVLVSCSPVLYSGLADTCWQQPVLWSALVKIWYSQHYGVQMERAWSHPGFLTAVGSYPGWRYNCRYVFKIWHFWSFRAPKSHAWLERPALSSALGTILHFWCVMTQKWRAASHHGVLAVAGIHPGWHSDACMSIYYILCFD